MSADFNIPAKLLSKKEKFAIIDIIKNISDKNKQYAIYGSGKITREIIALLVICQLPLPSVILDHKITSENMTIAAIPVCSYKRAEELSINHIILGTNTFQQEMLQKLNNLNIEIEVIDFTQKIRQEEPVLKKEIAPAKHQCPVCLESVDKFNSLTIKLLQKLYDHRYAYGFDGETMYFEKYSCPVCKSSDRYRLYALFLEEYFQGIDSKQIDILEFAPENLNLLFFRHQDKINRHIQADLYRPDLEQIDIQNIPYGNNEFDLFICSHVLEHVPDDIQAINELYRITKPGGIGICMVPVNLSLEKCVDGSLDDPEEYKWRHFGQYDHVHAYSKNGFIKRLQSAGFKVNQLDINYFSAEKFEQCAIHPRSVLYIVEKNT